MNNEKIIKILNDSYRKIPEPDRDFIIRSRMHLEETAKAHLIKNRLTFTPFKLAFATLAAFIILLSGSWMTYALAQDSLPGDTLYPVKTASEKIRIMLARNPKKADELHQKIIENRISELKRIDDLQNGRKQERRMVALLQAESTISLITNQLEGQDSINEKGAQKLIEKIETKKSYLLTLRQTAENEKVRKHLDSLLSKVENLEKLVCDKSETPVCKN